MTEKLVLLGRSGEISTADLPNTVNSVTAEDPFEFQGAVKPMMEIERLYAAWALGQTGGHRGQTAEKLGVDPKTLRKWLEEPDPE
jgi:DNA-binding NtrC family response regulator